MSVKSSSVCQSLVRHDRVGRIVNSNRSTEAGRVCVRGRGRERGNYTDCIISTDKLSLLVDASIRRWEYWLVGADESVSQSVYQQSKRS